MAMKKLQGVINMLQMGRPSFTLNQDAIKEN